MKKKILGIISCALVVCCVVLGLVFGLREPSFKDNMLNLMQGVKLGNDNFIGFSLLNEKDDSAVISLVSNDVQKSRLVKKTELQADAETFKDGTLVAVDENYLVEEIYFEKIGSSDNVSLDDIAQFGVITGFGIMDGLLYIQIVSNNQPNIDQIKEADYFSLSKTSLIFVVDLNTRDIYFLNDTITNLYDLQDAHSWGVYDISLEKCFIGVNLYIENLEGAVYSINVQNGGLLAKRVAGKDANIENFVVVDHYENKYLMDKQLDSYLDFDKIDSTEGFTILTLDKDKYNYFTSTDNIFYRALKTSDGTYVEKLNEDKVWALETGSSDKILRSGIGIDSINGRVMVGGDYMLVDGKVKKVATFFGTPVESCFIFGEKIYATVHLDGKESLICLGDKNQVDSEFAGFLINKDTYKNYSSIVEIDEDTNFVYLSVYKTRSGYILEKYNEKYKIIITNDGISFEEIKPMYNGFEILSDIIYR